MALEHVAQGQMRFFTPGVAPDPRGILLGRFCLMTFPTLEGAVKWFEPEKGYGFISPDGGGKDVFIHITALRRSGVNALGPGQRVRVDVIDGKKGLEADRITVIE